MSRRLEGENQVKVAFPFRKEKRTEEGIRMSGPKKAALDYLLKARIIDRSIGENDTPFPLLEDSDRYETFLLDVFSEAVNSVRSTLPKDHTLFFVDDDEKKIDNSLSTLSKVERPTVFILIDRERGVAERLKEKGVSVHSVITVTEINEFCLSNGYMSPEQYEQMKKLIEEKRPYCGGGNA